MYLRLYVQVYALQSLYQVPQKTQRQHEKTIDKKDKTRVREERE